MESVNRFAPQQEKLQQEQTDDWISNKIKNEIPKRNKYFHNWIDDPSTENHQAYKITRNKIKSMIRPVKQEANYKNIGVRPLPKTVYRTLNIMKRNIQPNPCLLDAKITNEYFVSIDPLLSSKLPKMDMNTKIPHNKSSTVFHMTNELEGMEIIKQMKKTFGCDGIRNEILKCCSLVVENSLANAFKECIVKSTVPKVLKTAKVVPMIKKATEIYRQFIDYSMLSSLRSSKN